MMKFEKKLKIKNRFFAQIEHAKLKLAIKYKNRYGNIKKNISGTKLPTLNIRNSNCLQKKMLSVSRKKN